MLVTGNMTKLDQIQYYCPEIKKREMKRKHHEAQAAESKWRWTFVQLNSCQIQPKKQQLEHKYECCSHEVSQTYYKLKQ